MLRCFWKPRWALFAGSTYQDTGASWITTGTIKIATSNQVNAVDNASNLFRITGVKLELGSVATPIQFVPFEEELARCQRYYQKSFDYAVAPAQNAGVNIGEQYWHANAAGAVTVSSPTIYLRPRMRVEPLPTLFNPAAANAQARNVTDGADLTATAYSGLSETGFLVVATGTAGTALGELLSVHWTADAELL